MSTTINQHVELCSLTREQRLEGILKELLNGAERARALLNYEGDVRYTRKQIEQGLFQTVSIAEMKFSKLQD